MTPNTLESNTQTQDTQDAPGAGADTSSDPNDIFVAIDQRPKHHGLVPPKLPPQLRAPDLGLDVEVLGVLFENRNDAEKAWMCAFGDVRAPNWTGAERKNWRIGGLRALAHQNAYVCNGTYRDGTKRAKENVEKIHFYVFDDIGSKVSYRKVLACFQKGGVIPALEVETSPGNETWLVAAKGIDTPEKMDRYTALQRALGRHGLTDPAMKDTTRYVRLPYGINNKKQYAGADGKAPVVRPLRVGMTKRWEIDEFAKALGLDLDAEIANETLVSSKHTGDTVRSAGHDPYVRALEELGLIQSQKPNGWIEIVCPWEHEHTTRGLTGTAYLPNAGWECHHGHCAGRSTDVFKGELRRLLDEKGVKGGSSGFLASHAFDLVEGDDAAIADEVRALSDKLGVSGDGEEGSSGAGHGFLDRIAYIANADRFCDLERGTFMNRNALNTVWTRALLGVLKRNKQGELAELPSTLFARMDGAKKADVPVYWPGKPTLFEHDGKTMLNTWRPARWTRRGRKIGSHEVRLWLKLVLDLCNGNRTEARVLLDHMARVVYEQDWKPGFAIILKGTQGIGKDMALSVLLHALGHTNFSVVTPDRIGARFNVSTEKRAIVVNEMKMTTKGALTAHDQYNTLKTLVGPLPEWVQVERKGIDVYTIPNRAAWYFTTNEDAPIAMDEADRRFFVIECKRAAHRGPAFYEKIADWLGTLDGNFLVAEWLEQRGAAMPAARVKFLTGNAPMNKAKQDMIDLTPMRGSPTARVAAWIGDWASACPDLVTAEDVKQEIAQAVKSGVSDLGQDMRVVPDARQLGVILAKLGWAKVAKSNVVPMPAERGGPSVRRYVWAVRDVAKWENSTKGEIGAAYSAGWGFQPPKGLAHGSADGSNVVALGKTTVSQDKADPVGATPGQAADQASDYPF